MSFFSFGGRDKDRQGGGKKSSKKSKDEDREEEESNRKRQGMRERTFRKITPQKRQDDRASRDGDHEQRGRISQQDRDGYSDERDQRYGRTDAILKGRQQPDDDQSNYENPFLVRRSPERNPQRRRPAEEEDLQNDGLDQRPGDGGSLTEEREKDVFRTARFQNVAQQRPEIMPQERWAYEQHDNSRGTHDSRFQDQRFDPANQRPLSQGMSPGQKEPYIPFRAALAGSYSWGPAGGGAPQEDGWIAYRSNPADRGRPSHPDGGLRVRSPSEQGRTTLQRRPVPPRRRQSEDHAREVDSWTLVQGQLKNLKAALRQRDDLLKERDDDIKVMADANDQKDRNMQPLLDKIKQIETDNRKQQEQLIIGITAYDKLKLDLRNMTTIAATEKTAKESLETSQAEQMVMKEEELEVKHNENLTLVETEWQAKVDEQAAKVQQSETKRRTLITNHDDNVRELKEGHLTTVNGLRDEKESLSRGHNQKIKSLEATHASEKATLVSNHEASQKTLKGEHLQNVEVMEKKMQALAESLLEKEQQHTRDKQALVDKHRNNTKALRESIRELNDALLTQDATTGAIFMAPNLPQMPDEQIRDQMTRIQQFVEELSDLSWRSDRTIWTDGMIRNLKSRFEPRPFKKSILQNMIWTLLFRLVFCSPFRMFGDEGRKLEQEWNKECGKGIEVLPNDIYFLHTETNLCRSIVNRQDLHLANPGHQGRALAIHDDKRMSRVAIQSKAISNGSPVKNCTGFS